MPYTNQIAVFFDHQYLWKELINKLDFLLGNNYQGKVEPEFTTFGLVCSVVPLVESDYRIF